MGQVDRIQQCDPLKILRKFFFDRFWPILPQVQFFLLLIKIIQITNTWKKKIVFLLEVF